jgi:hypothetical protein
VDLQQAHLLRRVFLSWSLVKPVNWDPLDLLDPPDPPDNQVLLGHQVLLDNQVLLDQLEHQALADLRDLVEQEVRLEVLDQLEHQALVVLLAKQVLLVPLVHQVLLEPLELGVLLVHQVLLDSQVLLVHQVLLDSQVLLDPLEHREREQSREEVQTL